MVPDGVRLVRAPQRCYLGGDEAARARRTAGSDMSLLAPGMTIAGKSARYRVLAQRGEGGFGIAWRGERESDGRPVLVKELRLERMASWKSFELFEREARVLEALDHPDVPRYHDFFAWDGEHAHPPSALASAAAPARAALVLVQDFVEGRSLAEAVTAGARFTGDEVERLFRSLLGVLAYLHALHPPVVHRDINPRNVIVRPDGRACLVDFGAIQDTLRFGEKMGSTNVGSFGFMPLEQLMGKAVPATDLYALGMTMLVAVTHRAPPELPQDEATAKVKVADVAPELAPPVRAALEGLVEPIVGKRTASARAALDVLDGRVPAPAPGIVSSPAPGSAPASAPGIAPAGAVLPGAAALPAGPAFTRARRRRRTGRQALFGGALGLGVAAAALVNLVLFDHLSERMLVRVSWTWFPPIAFGLSGFLARYMRPSEEPLPRALVITTLMLGALAVFLYGVFPAL